MVRDVLKAYGTLWLRAFSIVTLTAMNVVQISQHNWGGMFLTGCGISAVWWHNTHTAAHSTVPGAWLIYAFGAGCGTVCGTVVGMWLGGVR